MTRSVKSSIARATATVRGCHGLCRKEHKIDDRGFQVDKRNADSFAIRDSKERGVPLRWDLTHATRNPPLDTPSPIYHALVYTAHVSACNSITGIVRHRISKTYFVYNAYDLSGATRIYRRHKIVPKRPLFSQTEDKRGRPLLIKIFMPASTWHALGNTLRIYSRIVTDITRNYCTLLPMKIG